MTQQNAALVHERAASADLLKAHSGRLSGLVAGFRLDPSSPAAPLRARA